MILSPALLMVVLLTRFKLQEKYVNTNVRRICRSTMFITLSVTLIRAQVNLGQFTTNNMAHKSNTQNHHHMRPLLSRRNTKTIAPQFQSLAMIIIIIIINCNSGTMQEEKEEILRKGNHQLCLCATHNGSLGN